jgi:Family of unknown function (DUF6069)
MEAGFLRPAAASPLTAASFATGVLVCTSWGAVLATVLAKKAAQPARWFVTTTAPLTAVSLAVPIGAGGTTSATKVTLTVAHVLAAGIVIPSLARHLRPPPGPRAETWPRHRSKARVDHAECCRAAVSCTRVGGQDQGGGGLSAAGYGLNPVQAAYLAGWETPGRASAPGTTEILPAGEAGQHDQSSRPRQARRKQACRANPAPMAQLTAEKRRAEREVRCRRRH